MAITIKELIDCFKGLDENTPIIVTLEDSDDPHFITGVYGPIDDQVELEVSSFDDEDDD